MLPISPQFLFALGETMPASRLWCLSEDGEELLQLQRNWLACNWRRVKPDSVYGRYEPRRDSFTHAYSALQSFVERYDLGKVEPTMCEVTYVNHITPNAAWSSLREAHRVLNVLNAPNGRFLENQEQVQLSTQFAMKNALGSPFGQLHVSITPGLSRPEGLPMLVLNMTARATPADQTAEGVLSAIDSGREWSFKHLSISPLSPHRKRGVAMTDRDALDVLSRSDWRPSRTAGTLSTENTLSEDEVNTPTGSSATTYFFFRLKCVRRPALGERGNRAFEPPAGTALWRRDGFGANPCASELRCRR